VVECLFCKSEALNSNPRPTKKKIWKLRAAAGQRGYGQEEGLLHDSLAWLVRGAWQLDTQRLPWPIQIQVL
jgi:hypothetical protein